MHAGSMRSTSTDLRRLSPGHALTCVCRDLASLESDVVRCSYMHRHVLCHTLAGNACDVVTITAPAEDAATLAGRQGAVITGGDRQHTLTIILSL